MVLVDLRPFISTSTFHGVSRLPGIVEATGQFLAGAEQPGLDRFSAETKRRGDLGHAEPGEIIELDDHPVRCRQG